MPEHIRFPSVDGAGEQRTGHALFYPPANPRFRGPADERPPLLVVIHGGPTGKAVPVLAVGVQYWTSRGFAVVDVDYGGSSGYGRPYRELLRDSWGVVDVADCLAAARALADRGRVDPQRLCIRGGSAGGYTTLAALARDDTPFAAGADHFGVADLEALARDTHKFESRYLDGLIGPYPAARDVYVERSPITHVDRLRRAADRAAGRRGRDRPARTVRGDRRGVAGKGVPVAYLLFDGEQHGFRRAENVRRALDAELSFYAQVLGFTLPPTRTSRRSRWRTCRRTVALSKHDERAAADPDRHGGAHRGDEGPRRAPRRGPARGRGVRRPVRAGGRDHGPRARRAVRRPARPAPATARVTAPLPAVPPPPAPPARASRRSWTSGGRG